MTLSQYRTEVRRRYEALSPASQDLAARRGLGRSVFAWSALTRHQLERLLGATIAVALIMEEQL